MHYQTYSEKIPLHPALKFDFCFCPLYCYLLLVRAHFHFEVGYLLSYLIFDPSAVLCKGCFLAQGREGSLLQNARDQEGDILQVQGEGSHALEEDPFVQQESSHAH